MKEYFIFKIGMTKEDTKKKLNKLAREGWKLVCSYAWCNEYLIMEREKLKEDLKQLSKRRRKVK